MSELPRTFALLSPWPNPFNANVQIVFELPQAGPIELVIFDVTGRLVRKLANEEFQAGRHLLTWDGLDNEGRAPTNGVYLLRLRAGGQYEIRKIVMVR